MSRDAHQESSEAEKRFLYIFLDEAGNLDFSPSGTRFFILSIITKERPSASARFPTMSPATTLEKRPPRLLLRESPLGSFHRGGTFKLFCNSLAGV
jgi:hypothetical protein